MTVPGLDSSAFLPDDAGLAQAFRDGIRLWAGYFAGPGIWVGWPDSNFLRIKAAGMQSLAFCSGGSDPVACRARADRLGILFGPDVEADITDGGQAWLDASGTGGVYGGYAVMVRRAAWHIVADYRAIPGDTWPSYLARPPGPLGWQFQGTHTEYGGSVDRSRLDDFFAGPPAPQPQGAQMAYYMTTTGLGVNDPKLWLCDDLELGPKRPVWNPDEENAYNVNMVDQKVYAVARFVFDRMALKDTDALSIAQINAATQWTINDPNDGLVAIKAGIDALKGQVAALPPGSGGVDPNTKTILDKLTTIETALKGA